jgi:hypothetical protein
MLVVAVVVLLVVVVLIVVVVVYRMLWPKFISLLYSSLCNLCVCLRACVQYVIEVSDGSVFMLNGMVR